MAGNISDQTTHLSNLSVPGTLSVGTIVGSPALTGGAITGSTLSLTGAASLAAVTAATSVAVGGGTALTWAKKGTVSVVTMTCTAAGSTTTTATVAGVVAASDIVMVNPPSSMSSGINVTAFASGASQITLIFSNCSAAQQVVAGPLTVAYLVVRS